MTVAALLAPWGADAAAPNRAMSVEGGGTLATVPRGVDHQLPATERIDCQRRVSSDRLRRLTAAQRDQVRELGAYWSKPTRSRPGMWICVRSDAERATLARLADDLGASTADDADRDDVLGVSFPESLDRRLDIALPNGDSASWRMLDVAAVDAQPFAHGTIYSTSDFDVVQEVGLGRIKESIAVHTRQGMRTWSWKLAWNGGQEPELQADGTVRYGQRMIIRKPFITTAGGRRIKNLRWRLKGSTLLLTVDDRKFPLPYVIDPVADYPQRIYPNPAMASGTSVLESLANTAAGTSNLTTQASAATIGDLYFASGSGTGSYAGPLGTITDASAPNPLSNGATGWVQAALGGITLPAGPYTVSAKIKYVAAANTNLPVSAVLRARLWRVKLNAGTGFVSTSTPITGWSSGSTTTWTIKNTFQTLTTSLTPTSTTARQVAPSERIYVEYAVGLSDEGQLGSTLQLATDDSSTWVDFGGAASNTAGTAGNQRITSSPLNAAGWTTDTTPTFRADLDDPDYLHHLAYRVCSDAACGSVVQSGTTTAGQEIGSVTDSWTSPNLSDGVYFVRARTEEDGGDNQLGAWNAYTGTTCAAVNVGPCGAFGVDVAAPSGTITTATTGYQVGSVTITGTAADATSGVAGVTLQWTRTAPTAAGPSSTGITCTGTTAWSCTWNTAAVADGSYTLTLTVTDAADNTATATKSTYVVDNTAPTLPAAVNDGVSPTDIDWVVSLTQLQSFWTAATDATSGVAKYELCLSTATSCGGTIAVPWSDVATATNSTNGGLTLVENQKYYACVRATDVAGNVSTVRCSDGQTVDTVVPPSATVVRDGTATDVAWFTSTSISGNWTSGGDTGSGVASALWDIYDGASQVASGTTASNAFTTSVPSLVEGAPYTIRVREQDVAGNVSTTRTSSDGFRVDATAPPAPGTVLDGSGVDVDTSTSASQLTANWATVTDPVPGGGTASGLARYDLCVTTNAAGTNCAAGATGTWAAVSPATATTMTRTGLTLTDGTTYYVCIRAADVAGNVGTAIACSDGVLVDLGPPTATWTSWTENSAYLYAATGSNKLWYNPAAPLETGIVATGTVTATDGSGMGQVAFPNLGAGAAWGAGGTDTTVGASNTWSWGYTFTGGGAIGDPAAANAVASDNAGNSTNVAFLIDPDGTAPSGGSMPSITGDTTATSYTQPAVPVGTDAGSGVGRWILDTNTAPLEDGTCGTYAGWSDGSLVAGANGTTSNGSNLTITYHVNDTAPFDGVPDEHDSMCMQVRIHILDNVGNEVVYGPTGTHRFDFADPDVAITGPAAGAQSGTLNLTGTVDDNWVGGGTEFSNTGSGIDQVAVTYTGPSSGTACGPVTTFGGTAAAGTWSCSWNTSSLADGTYTVNVQARDRFGRLSTVATRTFSIDNFPPVFAFHSFSDGGSPWMHASGAVAWVNSSAPAGTYTLDARFTATDGGSGMNTVSVPTIGTGWTPAGTSNATLTSPVPATGGYTASYSFTTPGALTVSGPLTATATDIAGAASTATYEVRIDTTAPSTPTATVVDGLQSTSSVSIALGGGTEAAGASGVGSWTLYYDTAPLADDTCGTWANTWASAATGTTAPSGTTAHNVSALGNACYRYRLDVTDNVNNVATSGVPTTARRVDTTAPTLTVASPVTATTYTGSVTTNGTVMDAHSGFGHVRVAWTGPSATSGTVCDPQTTSGGSTPTWTYTCSWNTAALPDGSYVVTTTAYDRAGNTSTNTATIVLDNQPPTITFHSFVESTPYTYWSGGAADTTLWYNPTAPAGSYSFDVRVTAADAGSAISRVDFDGAGTGWTPGGAVGSQTTGIGPASRYSQTYTFDSSNAGLADPPTLSATAFDAANTPAAVTFDLTADAAAATGGSVTTTNGWLASTSATVTIDTGSDAGSGIASWQLLRATGTLTGATCGGWTGYATVVASGTSATSGTRTDTLADPSCAKYQLVVVDRVGNTATTTGADVAQVDRTAPTTSVTLVPQTNTAAQYLQNPTTLYVNTSVAAGGGSFDVNVNATAPSGMQSVTFPTLATGFSAGTVLTTAGPAYSHTYTFASGAGTPSASTTIDALAVGTAVTNSPFRVIPDTTAPTGALVTYTAGYTSSTSLPITYTTGTDAGSGIASYQLERETGTLAAGACTWSGSWSAVGAASGPLSLTETLTHATCYRYHVVATDNVGNSSTSTASTPVMVDTTAPTTASLEFIESGTGVGTSLASATSIWYDPSLGTAGSPASFDVRVRVTDPESGPGTISFPTPTGNWVLGAAVINADGATRPYRRWNSAAQPGTITAVAANGAGLSLSVTGSILADPALSSAASWTIDYAHGFDVSGSTTITFSAPQTDAESGFASWELVRRTYPFSLTTNLCDHTSFTDTSLGQPSGTTYVDTGLVQPTCYRYFLQAQDNVEHAITVFPTGSGAVPQVFDPSWPTWDVKTVAEYSDVTPPTAFTLTTPTAPSLPAITTGVGAPSCDSSPTFTGPTPTFPWSASSDAQSGLAGYDVYLDGTGSIDASVGAGATSWTSGSIADGAHTIGVRARDLAGNVRDAGSAFPLAIRVDSSAPTASNSSPANAAWTTDSTPTLTWSASDANCLARVSVYLDNLVTPVAVASGSESSWTPASAISEGTHTWRIDAVDAAGTTTSSSSTTFNVDTLAPNAFAVTAPTAGQTIRGALTVTWSASGDAGSGLAPSNAYRVLVDGTVQATLASGVTTTNLTGLANGAHTVLVRALDAAGNTTDTASVAVTVYPDIPAPVLLSPADGAKLNAVPTLTWNWPSDGGPAPTTFDVKLNGGVVATTTYPTMTSAISDPGDGLYTWTIDQHDAYTGLVSSLSRSFLLDRTAPNTPGPLTRSASTISWPTVVDPAAPMPSGMDYLEFVIDDGVNPPTVVTLPASATSYDYGVIPDGTYAMTVVAYDLAGNSSTSTALSVMNDSTPPTAFTLDPPAATPAIPALTSGVAPACEALPSYTSGTPTFSWQASTDAVSGIAGYDVYVDNTLRTTTAAGVTTWTPGSAISAGSHTWRVVARDVFGNATTSTPSSMSVNIDRAAPTVAFTSPANNAWVTTTTPSLAWSASDDTCLARIELTIDGAVAFVKPSGGSWTPTPLSEGSHTWSLRVFDSAGNVTATSGSRTVRVDSLAPSAVTALAPTDGSTPTEQMMTFQWSAATETGSGSVTYDLTVDGSTVATGLTGTSRGTYAIFPGAHTWSVRATDAAGNTATFPFTYTALTATDTTPPSAFNLLTPSTGSTTTTSTRLTWQAATDFHGVALYRVYFDGLLAGTSSGSTPSFLPTYGFGATQCSVDFDPSTSAACVSDAGFVNGKGTNSTATLGAASGDWSVAARTGWTSAGSSLGTGDPTITPTTAAGAGFDADRAWTAADFAVSVPSTGATLKFSHRYRMAMYGATAFDGGGIDIKVDTAGDGFTNDSWKSACAVDTGGVTYTCDYRVVENSGGFNAKLSNSGGNPLAYHNVFSGDSGGLVQTRVRLSQFAGKDVMIRFVVGTDACYSGITGSQLTSCNLVHDTPSRALWSIDDVSLADPDLPSGTHNWYVEAVDPAGNVRQSTQTWSFIVP